MRAESVQRDGQMYVRVSKTKARKVWEQGGAVVVAPVNANLHSGWYEGIGPVEGMGQPFESYVNSAEAHYAAEEGRYAKFFILSK